MGPHREDERGAVRKSLYIETRIRTDMAKLWRSTQDPAEHQRWDARFTEIDYIETETGAPNRRGATGVTSECEVTPEHGSATKRPAQHFRYATTVLGVRIHGEGITSNKRESTSALRFRSDHPLSMIVRGTGYWRYIPTRQGIRFLTGYDYVPRWAAADLIFRPMMGWATAWSFDRLRIWLEHDIPPERARVLAIADAGARATVLLIAVKTRNPLVGLLALVPRSDKVPSARRCLRRRPR